MHSVTLLFTRGPMKGERIDHDLGELTLGREPTALAPGQSVAVLKGAESSVSRNHATLLESEQGVVLRNLSGNGTLVDGNLVLEDVALKPGAKIRIGTAHELTVNWQMLGASEPEREEAISAGALMNAGPLASPVVRAVLVVYLLGIVAVVAWLMLQSSGGGYVADDWPVLEASYTTYLEEQVDAGEQAARLAAADDLVSRVRVLRIKNQTQETHQLCRELMALDADIESPLYRYGATCLGGF